MVVLENIYRHLELGEPPVVAAEKGGREVALPVLAATLTTVVVFFPGTLLYGVSKFLFSSLALAVVLSLFASYVVAMTVVPLFCARFHEARMPARTASAINSIAPPAGERFNAGFNRGFESLLRGYDALVAPVAAAARCSRWLVFAHRLRRQPADLSAPRSFFFPAHRRRPVRDQRQSAVRHPAGRDRKRNRPARRTLIRSIVPPKRPGDDRLQHRRRSRLLGHLHFQLRHAYGFRAGGAQAEGHKTGSYEYMARVKARMEQELPELAAFFSSGSLVDAVLNLGLAAPIDVQIAGTDLHAELYRLRSISRARFASIHGVADVYIPQDLDYPALQLDIDRMRAGELGLSEKEVVQNVITALTSNQMVAPNIWIDPQEQQQLFSKRAISRDSRFRASRDLRSIPLHGVGTEAIRPGSIWSATSRGSKRPPKWITTRSGASSTFMSGRWARIWAASPTSIDAITGATPNCPQASMSRCAEWWKACAPPSSSFAIGLSLSVVLLYLILVAQFRSFIDPFLILLAFPPGLTGVLLTLWLTGTTLNVMSLMGVVMLAGIAMSNSILIVEFAHHLRREGMGAVEAVAMASRVRLRPVLMTSLATVIGLLPMALKIGEGSESYAPLARALIGGLSVSVLFTVFLVPAGFRLAYARRNSS